jgi:cytoskeleton protein RodZ
MDTSDRDKEAKGISEDISLGSLLRRSREERHIDLDEAVSVTRIRRHHLEALENEEWSKLPSPVFVKGFLRSYAEFLGLDKEMVRNCYLRASPSKIYEPHVLKEVRPQSGRWHLTITIPVLALAFIAAIIYLERSDISIVGKAFQYMGTRSIIEKEDSALHEHNDKGKKDAKDAKEEMVFSKDEVVTEQEEGITSEPEPGDDTIILEESAILGEAKKEQSLTPQFTLTANVNSQTWIAIYIDEEPVKEYLFQPGETMRWIADKGFDILVGNAGGIELFLNGKEVGYLGPEGKVVRVKLPEGYE